MTPSIMSTAMSLGTLWAFMIFALFGIAFNAFLAFCLWRFVKCFEQLAANISYIAWKFKEEEARKGEQTGLVHPRF